MNRYAVIALVAFGTYLARLLPMVLGKRKHRFPLKGEFLDHMATSLLSALLVVSLVPLPMEPRKILAGILSLCVVYLSFARWNNLGLSVVAGLGVHLFLSRVLEVL